MSKYKVTLGADPELFVFKGGQVVPICGLVGGTKSEPLDMNLHPTIIAKYGADTLPPGFKYQEDGVAYEFNIPPAPLARSFEVWIQAALTYSNAIVAGAGLALQPNTSSNRFHANQLTDIRANTIGCDPDYRAYGEGGMINSNLRSKYEAADFGTTRFTGGHLHFGYDTDLADPHIFAALVDTFVYLPILNQDKQTDRRRFYGQAGLFRPKPYGIEYRTMSNFWLQGPMLSFIASQSFRLLDMFHDDPELLAEKFQQIPHDRVRALIDTGIHTAVQAHEHTELCKLIQLIGQEDYQLFLHMRDYAKRSSKEDMAFVQEVG